jgi:hypothetical protein
VIKISCDGDILDLPKTVVDYHWGKPERHSIQTYQKLFNKQYGDWKMGLIE